MLPGWKRQIARADNVALYVLYANSASQRELNGVILPGQSIVATPHSVVTFVDQMHLGSEADVFGFVEMVVDAWYDVRDFRAGRSPRDAHDTFDPSRLSDLHDDVSVELADTANDSARIDSIVAKLDGVVTSCDGVALRTAREVRALAQRLLATWRVVVYLRSCGQTADTAG